MRKDNRRLIFAQVQGVVTEEESAKIRQALKDTDIEIDIITIDERMKLLSFKEATQVFKQAIKDIKAAERS